MVRINRVCFLALLAGLAQGQWPQFRGPAGSGISVKSAPVNWSGESGRNIVWKREIPGLAHSSPIIWEDRIFLTSAVPVSGEAALKLGLYGDIGSVENEGGHKFVLYCLDRKSGKILWERTAISREPRVKRHPKS
ncbi:MAG: PQQ-binding-like beta-propeller repeat protein, partial [Bryobacteraceae bacterium]